MAVSWVATLAVLSAQSSVELRVDLLALLSVARKAGRTADSSVVAKAVMLAWMMAALLVRSTVAMLVVLWALKSVAT